MSLSSGGAGGGDSTSDTGTQDAVETVEESDTSGGDGLSAADIARIVRDILPWWVLNPPKALQSFIERPIATVLTIVVGFVFYDIVLPIVRGILQAGAAVIAAVQFLGQTIQTVGEALLSLLVGGVAPVGGTLLAQIANFNGAIGQAAASAGLGAPAVVAILWGIEIALVGYAVWSLVQVIDIPFVELSGIVRVLGVPFRLVVSLFR